MDPTDDAVLAEAQRLAELGYSQRLTRAMPRAASRAVSISIISFMTGPVVLFSFGMQYGGLSTMIWTWLIASPLVLCVALALAEVCSAYPLTGGPYTWTAALAPPRASRFLGYLVAWLNAAGNFAGTAFAAFGVPLFFGALAAYQGWYTPTKLEDSLLSVGLLAFTALLNTCAVRVVGWLNRGSVWVHVGGLALIAFCVASFPAHHQSARVVFSTFTNASPWGSRWYVVGLSLLVIMETVTGFDSPGHMAEETEAASRNAPRAMWTSVAWSCVLGLALIVTLAFATQNPAAEAASPLGAVPQILIDAIPQRGLVVFLLAAMALAQCLCVMSCQTSGSRMLYGAARDGAIPFSGCFFSTASRTNVPAHGVWAMAVFPALLVLLSLHSATLFVGVTAFTASTLFLVYAIPTLLRLIKGDRFVPGPWRLRRPRLVGWAAVVYVAVAVVLTSLPTGRPVLRWANFPWSPVGIGVLLLLLGGFYLRRGRREFHVPPQLTGLQAAEIDDAVV